MWKKKHGWLTWERCDVREWSHGRGGNQRAGWRDEGRGGAYYYLYPTAMEYHVSLTAMVSRDQLKLGPDCVFYSHMWYSVIICTPEGAGVKEGEDTSWVFIFSIILFHYVLLLLIHSQHVVSFAHFDFNGSDSCEKFGLHTEALFAPLLCRTHFSLMYLILDAATARRPRGDNFSSV